jgi:hypothetical protein
MTGNRAIEMIRLEYTRAIGPMAHLVIDETLADFGASAELFPAEKLPEFVEKLGWEIHSEPRRVSFQKETLRRLQELR